MAVASSRTFGLIFSAVIIVKLYLAWWAPVFGDEAYFLVWGRFPDLGYYDHPPMIGWVVFLLSLVGDSLFFYRLFPILSGVVIGLLIHRLVLDVYGDVTKARLVTLVYLLSPAHLLHVLVLNDTPLVLFVFLSGFMLFRGLRNPSAPTMLLCGLFLGLAVLSKFLAVLLLPACAICLFLGRSRSRPIQSLFWIVAGLVPALLVVLYWNYNNSWATVMFNLVHRHKARDFEIGRVLGFVGVTLYALTPWLLWFLFRQRKKLAAQEAFRASIPFLVLLIVPVAILVVVGFRELSPHWVLAFLAFIYLPAAAIDGPGLARNVRYSAWFAAFHLVILSLAFFLPLDLAEEHEDYAGAVLFVKTDAVAERLREYEGDYEIMAASNYCAGAALTHFLDRHVPALLSRSRFGRLDDKVVDFRDYDGKDILVFSEKPLKPERYEGLFRQQVFATERIAGADFHVIFGKGFLYDVFRERHLRSLQERYYTNPYGLPMGRCYFNEKYFPEDGDRPAREEK